MTAAWMWARAELRTRWKAWVLLGLLAGVTVGVAAAGWAGARRTERAVPDAVAAARIPTAAVLANDPAFDEQQRAAVARLPGVTATYPFMVGFSTQVFSPRHLGDETSSLFPTEPASMAILAGPLVAGRLPNPARADEVVVDENTRDRYHLDLGSTMVVGQDAVPADEIPPGLAPAAGATAFRERMKVVGIAKSVSSDLSWTPSSGFYTRHREHLPAIVNEFVDLRAGRAGIPAFTAQVDRLVGHPVNVGDLYDLDGIRKALNVTDLERDGLLLFALAALLGGGVLVGQALVRSVSSSAADLPTWRAMGADRWLAVRALLLPAVVTAVVGAATSVGIAIALSSRFPLGTARDYELHLGTHADWFVLGLAAVAMLAGVMLIAAAGAWWRVTHSTPEPTRPSFVDRLVAPMSRAPALMIGARLAGEPGRGRRAVPVRSALVGAIAGVIGVVGCLTFRAGLHDAAHEPRRSGVVWNYVVAAGEGTVPRDTERSISGLHAVDAALDARWERAVPVNGAPVPVFGTRTVKGSLPLIVVHGRAPRTVDEIAFAPTTMHQLGLHVGQRVRVGATSGVRIVGEALLPATSHTDYDQSGWMTAAALRAAAGPPSGNGEDYLLLGWRPDANAAAAERQVKASSGSDLYTEAATLPVAVADLARIEDLPLALGAFFALLACATVAHALVTTVRRRRHDLAVLRAIGFTRRQTRGAIAWQSTLLVAAGLVVGVPVGLAVGRLAWRWLADDFPIVYVPPTAVLAVVLVAAIAVALANAIAAGPAHAATRIHPAEALRVE
jgi:ABC-type antimicrobial peptide transport system permease subunit